MRTIAFSGISTLGITRHRGCAAKDIAEDLRDNTGLHHLIPLSRANGIGQHEGAPSPATRSSERTR